MATAVIGGEITGVFTRATLRSKGNALEPATFNLAFCFVAGADAFEVEALGGAAAIVGEAVVAADSVTLTGVFNGGAKSDSAAFGRIALFPNDMTNVRKNEECRQR